MRNAICDVPCSVYIMEEECCQWSGCGKYELVHHMCELLASYITKYMYLIMYK